MAKKENHLLVKEMGEKGLDFRIDSLGLMFDLKALINEYYIATFAQDESGLILCFNNGQKFKITVNEIK